VFQNLLSSTARELLPTVAGGSQVRQSAAREMVEEPEATLLVRILRGCFYPATTDRELQELLATVDWTQFFALAATHHVEPLVFRYFQANPGLISPEVAAKLQFKSRAIGFRNLVLTRELVRLADLFSAAGIDLLPMKGPVVAHQVYGDVGQRQFGDLDILVRPRQLQAARALLAAEGYYYQDGWSSWRQRAYEHFGHHYGYYHPQKCVYVELHWRVMPKNVHFPIETRSFWDRLQLRPIGGAEVPCSPPEDLLLMLTAHGSRHRWERLSWVCDIAALLHACPELDWDVVERRARVLGAVRMLDLGLLVASELLGTSLPARVIDRLRVDAVTRSLGADVRSMLFTDINFETAVGVRWRYFLRLRERVSHQLGYVVGQTENSLFWRLISSGRSAQP